jgi:hypothetical protein
VSQYADLKTLENNLKQCAEMIGLEKAFKWEIFQNSMMVDRNFTVSASFVFEPSFRDTDPVKAFYKKFADIEENLQTGMLAKRLNDEISKLQIQKEILQKEMVELEKFKTHYQFQFNMKHGNNTPPK